MFCLPRGPGILSFLIELKQQIKQVLPALRLLSILVKTAIFHSRVDARKQCYYQSFLAILDFPACKVKLAVEHLSAQVRKEV